MTGPTGRPTPAAVRSRPVKVLLAGTARGDGRAFAELYRRLGPRVLVTVELLVPPGPAAERVVVDVFVRIWRGAGTFDPREGPAMTWVTDLARRRALDHFHRHHHAFAPGRV